MTYIEEGEFKNDELDCTFGRRIYINGNTSCGYYLRSGETLHGYGIDSQTGKEGLFEEGIFQPKHEQIKVYDYDIDFIAKKIDLNQYK